MKKIRIVKEEKASIIREIPPPSEPEYELVRFFKAKETTTNQIVLSGEKFKKALIILLTSITVSIGILLYIVWLYFLS